MTWNKNNKKIDVNNKNIKRFKRKMKPTMWHRPYSPHKVCPTVKTFSIFTKNWIIDKSFGVYFRSSIVVYVIKVSITHHTTERVSDNRCKHQANKNGDMFNKTVHFLSFFVFLKGGGRGISSFSFLKLEVSDLCQEWSNLHETFLKESHRYKIILPNLLLGDFTLMSN